MNLAHGRPKRISRRALIAAGGALLGGLPKGGAAQQNAPSGTLKVATFSKHLRFLEGAELARGAAAIGFDVLDILVRKGGHVEPARVRQDLPPLVAAIRERGLEVPMITTAIADSGSPNAADIMAAMAELKIRYYR